MRVSEEHSVSQSSGAEMQIQETDVRWQQFSRKADSGAVDLVSCERKISVGRRACLSLKATLAVLLS
jgi:hypothetical protein